MLLEVNFVKVSKTDVPIEHSTVLATVKTVKWVS